MAFTHGVYTQELATSIVSSTNLNSGLPVVVGTAPINLGDISNVNKPQLIYSYSEAVKLFGYSEDWENYTLCEFMYSQFVLYGMSPCVLINVLDPSKHSESVTDRNITITSGSANLGGEIVASDLELASALSSSGSRTVYVKDTDYTLEVNDDGELIVNVVPDGGLANKATVYASYTKLKPSAVTNNDVIGGVNASGKYTGLELISRIYPKFALIPGLVAAPKFSESPEVAAVMTTKAQNINGLFNAIAIVDIPSTSSTVNFYTKANEWKSKNNYTSEHMIACWPKVKLGEKLYHMSTQLVGLINTVDAANDDVPYASPSNHSMQIDSCVDSEGNEINLGIDEANELNRVGILTALNWSGGWRAWGNRTAIYPASSDVKDCFIPVRRMFDYLRNDFITMFWQETDAPITRRLIRTIVNSYNVRLNGLCAREMLLGGRIEFLDGENPTTDLLNGSLRFHIYITPPTPAETITGIFEFDPENLKTLFASEA